MASKHPQARKSPAKGRSGEANTPARNRQRDPDGHSTGRSKSRRPRPVQQPRRRLWLSRSSEGIELS